MLLFGGVCVISSGGLFLRFGRLMFYFFGIVFLGVCFLLSVLRVGD